MDIQLDFCVLESEKDRHFRESNQVNNQLTDTIN